MKRVLVVDDSELARKLLDGVLREAGFDVLQATDGAEGAMLAMRERPDAVVTDLEMPTMDGYLLARLLKSDPATGHIPVIILTSRQEAPSRFWGLETGADVFLTKDEIQERLAATVSELIQTAPPRPEIEAPAPAGSEEVLARVASHLYQSLREATLAGIVLESGARGRDLTDTRRRLLETLNALMDAHLLGFLTVEPHGSSLQVFLSRRLPSEVVNELIGKLQLDSELLPEAPARVVVDGDLGPGTMPDLEDLVVLDLPFRDAEGALVVLPADLATFTQHSLPVLESLRGHLALSLDNPRLAERLRELSTLDGLTRVLNHRAILERLGQELERARRHKLPLSVILCDLDHFKIVNDTHGHLVGDGVLRNLAVAMRAQLRTGDALGRYGGEEFLVVLYQSELATAVETAERLRETVEATVVETATGRQVKTTVSCGVASSTELQGSLSIRRLLALTDRRLYEAKAVGRNVVVPAVSREEPG